MLPSPRTSDTNGAGHHGDGGMDLRTAVAEMPLLPTPAAKEPGGTPEQYRQRLRDHDGRESSFLPLSMAVRLLGTPTARDHKGSGPVGSDSHLWLLEHGNVEAQVLALLPTPRASDGPKGGPNQRGSSGDLMLPSAVSQLLPTPTATDSKSSGSAGYTTGHDGTTLTGAVVRQPSRWGEYEPAIRRWESITRPAPEPTKLNAKGNPKLSDEFDEWLMGLPAGWITDVPGITWNEVLKACGNGVVWQQCAAALRFLRVMADWQVAA